MTTTHSVARSHKAKGFASDAEIKCDEAGRALEDIGVIEAILA